MTDPGLGVCVIGRNEGAQLRACLSSVRMRGDQHVYVDSNSTDDSVEVAQSFPGVDVLRIEDPDLCTAARGRNIGFDHLWNNSDQLEFVQFVDGDCILVDGWIDSALNTLRTQPDVAVVAGHLHELNRDRNVYHRLAEMEWNTGGTGEVPTVGGIFMVRAEVFRDVGGMNPWMGQGEEAELAKRIREKGHRVMRLDVDMGCHDIAIDRFGQWWARSAREGRATAHSVLIAHTPDREALRHLFSMMFWGAAIPVTATALTLPTLGMSWGLFASYGLLWKRVRESRLDDGNTPEDASLYATATVLGKVANASGVARYALNGVRWRIREQLLGQSPAGG